MPEPTALFFDLGGVVLTNGWDRRARQQAIEQFQLDPEEFHERHELAVYDWEMGRITLDEYLDRTVFYRPRPFTRETFREFIFAQSRPYPESLELLEQLSRSRVLLAALNNESAELNEYRIRTFGLRRYFVVFLSSCYLGVRKPEPRMFQLALQLTQRSPEEAIFIDDRPVNVEAASRLGMHAVRYRGIESLRHELVALGIKL